MYGECAQVGCRRPQVWPLTFCEIPTLYLGNQVDFTRTSQIHRWGLQNLNRLPVGADKFVEILSDILSSFPMFSQKLLRDRELGDYRLVQFEQKKHMLLVFGIEFVGSFERT